MGFDVIVIGGGHAGCEAALAAARMGHHTALITLRRDRIGHMPCNPAVGGLAKGHLVKEVDALGGEIGRAADVAGIQFRMLNRGKGPAVWSPRAQSDKVRYAQHMQNVVAAQPMLSVVEAEVSRLQLRGERFTGVELADGSVVSAPACVLTSGTFLRGLMHTGDCKTAGGREGEPAAGTLSAFLRSLGLRMGRLKTGTPPRVLKSSVDLSRLEEQPGDDSPSPFSYRTSAIELPQVSCHLTYTSAKTHDVIRANLDKSPMYRGVIEGIGPRYCPSIEDKVVRFADKDRHQVFIEPEGLDHPELYLNGISTSLPADVQEDILASIPGLESARMARPGYAVEYDFFPPDQLLRTMESKVISGLFFAGQVNGTSGYEEAAAQGFIAGVNAVMNVRQSDPLVLGRDEAYIGVMLDDLTTKEIDEPYRMFTSRAEFRLLLRQDNADERLMPAGNRLGLVPDTALAKVEARKSIVKQTINEMVTRNFPTAIGNPLLVAAGLEPVTKPVPIVQVLKRPGVTLEMIAPLLDCSVSAEIAPHVESLVKYEGYVTRQLRDIANVRDLEARRIPVDFGYEQVPGLSAEAQQKLQEKRPESVGQASRIAGVRAADLSILVVHLERHSRDENAAASA